MSYNNQDELIPVWLVLVRIFFFFWGGGYHVNKYREIYAVGMNSFWYRLIPVSRKRPLRLNKYFCDKKKISRLPGRYQLAADRRLRVQFRSTEFFGATVVISLSHHESEKGFTPN